MLVHALCMIYASLALLYIRKHLSAYNSRQDPLNANYNKPAATNVQLLPATGKLA